MGTVCDVSNRGGVGWKRGEVRDGDGVLGMYTCMFII